MPTFSDRMNAVKPSATVQVANKVQELKAAGEKVISFSIGVPGFLPPQHVYDAAHAAIDQDTGNYFPGKGVPVLIQAFKNRLAEDGFHYSDDELSPALGGKNALFNLMQALCGASDEVLYPTPYWVSYPDITILAGATPKSIYCGADQNYKLTPQQLEASITPKTKVFIFNNPNNPTGMVYSEAEVKALGDVLEKHPNIWILSDDIYDKMIFTGDKFHHLLKTNPSLKNRTAIMQSVSKTYGMPGWRCGMVAAPEALTKKLITLIGQSVMNVPGVVMAAGAAAFGGDHTFLDPINADFEQKLQTVMNCFDGIDGLTCPQPNGVFYAFPDVSSFYEKTTANGTLLTDDIAFCTALLEEQKVALIPGSASGENKAVRFSYACDEVILKDGLSRFESFMKGLK